MAVIQEKKYWLGPSSWPQWLLALLPFASKFNPAAKKHDIGYGLGGDIIAKNSEDKCFIIGMKETYKYNIFAWFFALFYYKCVCWFGKYYFNWSRK